MKYGFIGCGNMGGAIARALCKSTTDVLLTDRSGKGRNLALELGCEYDDSATVAESCDRIFLAVKPQMMAQVLESLQMALSKRKPLIITMAAGLEMEKIQELIGEPVPMIRMMPNTPVSVGCGMIPYCYNALVTADILKDFLQDMQYAGKFDAIPENLMDAASALSGSGPAYLYLLLEAMADGAVVCGLSRQKAIEYAAVTMEGAAKMLLSTGQHPGELKDAVCSPGGSTIVGIQTLESQGFRGAMIDCIQAAYRKNKELGK